MNHNLFSLRDINKRQFYPCQKEFALIKQTMVLHSMKDSNSMVLNMNNINDNKKKKRTKENLLLKKTRLFKREYIFDSITLSHDFLNCIDEVLKCFNISKYYHC